MNELVRAIATLAALVAVVIVFADMEGSNHANTNGTSGGPGGRDFGDLVFLEPVSKPETGAAVGWVLSRAGLSADLAGRGRSSASAPVSASDPVSGGTGNAGRDPVRSGSLGGAVAYLPIVRATHYGAAFNGRPLGCPGAGTYQGSDATVAAVADALVPCGTALRVCGAAGCVDVRRVDTCPGCGSTLIDLSEAGHAIVCGPGGGVCAVSVERKGDE